MPNLQYFDSFDPFLNAVVDYDRGVHQPAYAWTIRNNAPDVGKVFKELKVIQEGFAESFCRRGKVRPRIADYLLKVR